MSELEPRQPDSAREITRAISTPFWDGFLTGGLSLVAMSALLFYVLVLGGELAFSEADWITLALLVNSPHFMASYRVLYDSKARILAHPWSTLYVPIGLGCVLLACALVARPGPIVQVLVLVGSVYLAWHYAGQTWGMVASFSHIAGVHYSERERWCIRAGPRCLLTLHVLFALSGRLPPQRWIDPGSYVTAYTWVFWLVCGLIGLSLGAGIWAFRHARARGERVPIRAVLPWASLYLWYPFWYFVPGGFMWVQLSHALQYMAFPLRVDVNRFAARRHPTAARRRLHVLLVYLGLVLLGAIVLHGPPLAAHAFGHGWYSTPYARMLLMVVTQCVGIHHYFVDGAIWRLRNAEVRGELFSHLPSR